MSVSNSGYFTTILVITVVSVFGVAYNRYQKNEQKYAIEDNEKAKKEREQAVIARLIDIRKAQQEYRSLHHGMYTDLFDTLIDFVKTQKIPFVSKEGVLSDKQLEDGMTEKKAMAMINKAKKTNNWKEVEAAGLMGFKRDTIWVAVTDTIYDKSFNADSLRYVPFGGGAQFEKYPQNDIF